MIYETRGEKRDQSNRAPSELADSPRRLVLLFAGGVGALDPGQEGKGFASHATVLPTGVEGLSFNAAVGSCLPSLSWLVSRCFFNDRDSGLRSSEVVVHVRFGVLASVR
jgi:hypothetical protein